MIQKQGHWVPYELKPRDVERRFGTCELLLQRQKRKGFTKKWIDSWIASKDMSFFRRGIHVLPERWEKVVFSDGQYFK
ncbi:MOS1T transposase, partial [Pseudoatta argentina]